MMARRQEGSVLLLAMLVLLVMTATGLMVVHNVTGELANVGAYRVMKQGYYLTEAGLAGPIAQAASDQNVFMGFLQGNSFQVRTTDIHPQFYDFSSWGSFGPEFSTQDSAQFVTYFSSPVDTHRIPGFSVGNFCYRKYTVTADGYLGAGAQSDPDEEDPDSLEHTAMARFVSQVYLGPFQCGF